MTATPQSLVAVVTGAASGIGCAAALGFSAAGYGIALMDRDAGGMERTLASIREQDADAASFVCDVSDPASVKAAHEAVLARYGRIDAAVNSAGMEGEWVRMAEEPLELFDRVMAVNLRGVWLCMVAQIRAMQNVGGGSIVNVSSGAGLVGSTRSAIYSASKHGVIGLTKSAALQYPAEGIRINAVCPGGVDTPMATRIRSTAPSPSGIRGPGGVALGRYSTAEEIAATALWLCSPAAASIIGVALPVDGGLTAA